MVAPLDVPEGCALGRYVLYDAISSGGMGSVHVGRLVGPLGFSRTVAIKKLHAHLKGEAEFVAMFLDEARLAARIQHPNVVPTIDVVVLEGEIFLVMEYVHGESLANLVKSRSSGPGDPVPPAIACAIAAGMLHGLHAAHEARGAHGETLDIVHRDVSPQNVMIGVDGTARVFDFGIAKAAVRLQSTEQGKVKGKIPYMAPEQLRGKAVTRAADIYAASVVLWEMLAGRRLFHADNEGSIVEQVLTGLAPSASKFAREVPPELDDLIRRGMERDPLRRFLTARQMAIAIEGAMPPASASDVGAWVRDRATSSLAERADLIGRIERATNQEMAQGVSGVLGTPLRLRHRKWKAAAASGAALAVVVALGLAVTARTPQLVQAAPTPAVSAGDGPAVAPGSAEPASPPVASSAPPPAAPATIPSRAIRAAPGGPKRGSHPSSRADCNPPYTHDAAGHVQWKVECL